MPSSRLKLWWISSILGLGCLVCTAAALAFLRRRNNLKDKKVEKECSKRKIISDQINRRKLKSLKHESSVRASSAPSADSSKATINGDLKIGSDNQLMQCKPVESASLADCYGDVCKDAVLQSVISELKSAIDNLETHLRNESTTKSVVPFHTKSDDLNIKTELERLQGLLQTISTGQIESNRNQEFEDGVRKSQWYITQNEDNELSSDESFVSANESIDLEDETTDLNNELASEINLLTQKKKGRFYNSALQFLLNNDVPIRTYRSALMHCDNDFDFCAKTYCLRIAFQIAFTDEANREFFQNSGKKLLTGLLLKAKKDPNPFLKSLDAMIEFCSEKENWTGIEEELSSRGVCCMTFVDIVLDFIVMDSLDDLTEPPYAVTTAIQNRWLSQGIKESALSTAIWSILSAKSRLLKNQNGFLTRMYSVSKHISPVLAWGLLGPVEDLKRLCNAFKDGLLSYSQDIFNADKVSYESPEQLSIDVITVAKERQTLLSEVLLT